MISFRAQLKELLLASPAQNSSEILLRSRNKGALRIQAFWPTSVNVPRPWEPFSSMERSVLQFTVCETLLASQNQLWEWEWPQATSCCQRTRPLWTERRWLGPCALTQEVIATALPSELGLGLFSFHYLGQTPELHTPKETAGQAAESELVSNPSSAKPLSCVTLRKCLCSSVSSSVNWGKSSIPHQIVRKT